MATATILVLVAPAGQDLAELVPLSALVRLAGCEVDWLDRPHAAQLPFPAKDRSRLQEVEALLAGRPVDRALLPAHGRRKRLLLCDMDSTVITVECIDELAARAGLGAEVAALTRRAMAGEIPFADALVRRVSLLAGLPVRVIDEILRERVRLQPGARRLVATMRAHGAFCALVSGGFTEFTRHVRVLAGFDADYANTLEIRDGVLTGRVLPPLLGPEAKLHTLLHLARRFRLDLADTLAIGDGANDLDMVRTAGLGIAFRGHAVLRASADACIDHADLTAALYFQGFRREEMVELGEPD
ncbi:Phosphoserine phosphatase SerB2 [bacterium HR40]|nr:Phosphoserine phosphatase SerB2 [bacterium HR40]